MAVIYRIEPPLGLLYYLALDECTGTQFIQAARAATQDECYRPRLLIIYDLIAMTDLEFDSSLLRHGVKHLYEMRSADNRAEKTAIISRSRFGSDILHALELLASDIKFDWKIFPDLLSALPWLGLAEATTEVLEVRTRIISATTT